MTGGRGDQQEIMQETIVIIVVIPNPKSAFEEEETHKILWDFEIQTDHLIPAWRPGPESVNKKKKHII